MKKRLLLFIASFSIAIHSFSQGASCATADPFCTENGAAFPASTNTVAEVGPEYDCLGSQPNPAWYFMQIATSGNIDIDLSNSANVDIDFACWGPFANLASACGNLTEDPFGCGLPFFPPCNGTIVDCSFSTSATEQINIPNAQAGEFYMVLITNFSGLPTDIFANSTAASTGATDCSIVPPAGCFVSSLTANIGACEPGSVYTLDGTFEYSGAAASGSVIVEVDNGTSTFTQTFPAPFTVNQTFNYSIGNIPADGAASTVTVYFSADPACNLSMNYTATANCSCNADIGTFTVNYNGTTITPTSGQVITLCENETLTITPNGDFTPADEQFAPPGPTYDPGIGWLAYSCPPTIGFIPTATEEVADDPCLLGVVATGTLNEINDLFWINSFPPGTFTDNIVYFVPITMYSSASNIYSYVNTTVPCYELGPVYPVQYLPPFTTSNTQDCATEEVTASFVGGMPAIDGSNYTVVVGTLTPATAVFVNTTCGPGGNIVLGNVQVGDNYSFDVQDNNGCTVTVSGTMLGSGAVDLSYPQHNYCKDEPNPTATVVGTAGGTFTSVPAGLSLNPATGAITLSASTAGSYIVAYQAPGAACPPIDTFSINVFDLPVVNAGVDQGVCQGTPVTLTGAGAPTLSWNNGILNGIPFSPNTTTTYTLTGINAAGCTDTDDVTVTVESNPSPTFVADVTNGCVPLTVTLTSTGGGTNCVWTLGDGTVINGCGPIVHTFTSVGCYDVTLQAESALGCVGSTTITDYICASPDPVANFAPTPATVSELNPVSVMNNTSTNAVTYQWSFEDGGTSTQVSPTHTFPITPGAYEILLVATSQFGCVDSITQIVTVLEELIFYVPNTFTPDGDEYNQSFKPVFTSGFDPMDYNLTIFDRWGEILFESNNHEIGWDGTYANELVKDGVYVWKIEFKTSRNDARRVEVGHVTVLK